MKIYCCECAIDVNARLTNGLEIYPHRKDLKSIPFWICDECGNYVGCHHKTKNKTKPLGVIPSNEIKIARRHLHRLIDPICQSGMLSRGDLYRRISNSVGHEYHTAEIRTIDEARNVYRIVKIIHMEVNNGR